MKAQMEKDTVDSLFKETVSTIKTARSIDAIADAIEQNDELKSRLLKGDVTRKILKQEARRLMKSVKDDFGFPLFMSVRVVGEDGTESREYKQPQLFDKSEFEQTIDYYGKLTVHYGQTTVELRNRCQAALGKQIPLPFDERALLLD